jgi:hypothetical protein
MSPQRRPRVEDSADLWPMRNVSTESRVVRAVDGVTRGRGHVHRKPCGIMRR